MLKNKEQILEALSCCTEFECGKCPYQHLDSQDYPLRCIHILIQDIYNNLIIKCEDCDFAYPCFSPFDQKNYVRCTYLATGDGKTVRKNHFCKAGERRTNDACE